MAWRPRLCNYLLMSLFCSFVGVKTRDVLPQKENYLPSYAIYHNVTSLRESIVRLVRANPEVITFHHTFHSRQKLPIHVLRVKPLRFGVTALNNPDRPLRVLVVAGEHAREFIPVESVLYLLDHLTHSPNSQLTQFLRINFDLFIIPMLNPDGRRHIEQSSNFCWRGTSTGVDIGRNFPWEFGAGGSSSKANDEEYHGTVPFSGEIKKF